MMIIDTPGMRELAIMLPELASAAECDGYIKLGSCFAFLVMSLRESKMHIFEFWILDEYIHIMIISNRTKFWYEVSSAWYDHFIQSKKQALKSTNHVSTGKVYTINVSRTIMKNWRRSGTNAISRNLATEVHLSQISSVNTWNTGILILVLPE